MREHSCCFLVNILVMVVLCASASLATELPSQIFSIEVTVGVATLEEVRKIYGIAEPQGLVGKTKPM